MQLLLILFLCVSGTCIKKKFKLKKNININKTQSKTESKAGQSLEEYEDLYTIGKLYKRHKPLKEYLSSDLKKALKEYDLYEYDVKGDLNCWVRAFIPFMLKHILQSEAVFNNFFETIEKAIKINEENLYLIDNQKKQLVSEMKIIYRKINKNNKLPDLDTNLDKTVEFLRFVFLINFQNTAHKYYKAFLNSTPEFIKSTKELDAFTSYIHLYFFNELKNKIEDKIQNKNDIVPTLLENRDIFIKWWSELIRGIKDSGNYKNKDGVSFTDIYCFFTMILGDQSLLKTYNKMKNQTHSKACLYSLPCLYSILGIDEIDFLEERATNIIDSYHDLKEFNNNKPKTKLFYLKTFWKEDMRYPHAVYILAKKRHTLY